MTDTDGNTITLNCLVWCNDGSLKHSGKHFRKPFRVIGFTDYCVKIRQLGLSGYRLCAPQDLRIVK